MKGWSFLKINDLLHLFDSKLGKVDIVTSEHSNSHAIVKTGLIGLWQLKSTI